MSNSASYKLYFRGTKEDVEKLREYLKDRQNFPYDFQVTHKSKEFEGMVGKELTVQAEERNRSFSGPDGYLMELVVKFPEMQIPYPEEEWMENSGIEYSDDDGEGFLSKKEDGFLKIGEKLREPTVGQPKGDPIHWKGEVVKFEGAYDDDGWSALVKVSEKYEVSIILNNSNYLPSHGGKEGLYAIAIYGGDRLVDPLKWGDHECDVCGESQYETKGCLAPAKVEEWMELISKA